MGVCSRDWICIVQQEASFEGWDIICCRVSHERIGSVAHNPTTWRLIALRWREGALKLKTWVVREVALMHTLLVWGQHLLWKNLLLSRRAWRIFEVIGTVKLICILLPHLVLLVLWIVYFLKLDKVTLFGSWRWSSGHTATLPSTPLIRVNFNLQFLVKLFLRLVRVLLG